MWIDDRTQYRDAISLNQPAIPIGYTIDGRPLFGGQTGNFRSNPPWNGLAIAALVVSFVIPLLGFILGQFATKQIDESGEQGRPLAVAASLIGLIGTLTWLVLFFVLVSK